MKALSRFVLLAGLACVSAWGQSRAKPDAATGAAGTAVPRLGGEVPDALRKRAAGHVCDTGEGRREPCAAVTLRRTQITVAWDDATRRVTYLYSTVLRTDDDIAAGDVLQIGPETPVTPFPGPGTPHRFVSVDWCDTARDVSGDAEWCAVMMPVHPRSGKVVGFVQSLYLALVDPDAMPIHRAGYRRAQRSPRVGAR